MRFLQVTTSMDPKTGGPPAVLRAITPELALLGHESEFVTCEAPEGPVIGTIMGCPIHRLGPPKNSYQYCPAMEDWIRRNASRFDAVFVHGLWQHHGLCTHRALKGSGVPYFVYTHGMLDPWFKRTYPLKHIKKWFYWNLFERRLLKDASAVLFTCDEERQLARQSFSNSSYTERVVEFGTARPNANESSARQAFAEAFPKAAQAPFLLFMSRIHPKKGVDLLLKAYGEIQSEFPAKLPPLLIAGPCHDAAYLEELKTLAQKLCPADSVVWTGMIEGDVKWGALHSCEAFVLPSHQENFGIAVTEAMAVARPVLISDKVNIWREIVDDGGGLAATDSIQGTRQTLMHWAEMSATARAAMGAAALASFERRFEIKAVAKGLIRTVEPFLNTQAPGTQA